MELRRIRIESFRALDRLDLRLRSTSVIIGAQSTGKTSLVDALAAAAGFDAEATGFGFRSTDFRWTKDAEASSIRVVLDFREVYGEDGEANEELSGDLLPAVFRDREGRASVRLEVTVRRGAGEQVDVDWRFTDAAWKTLVDSTQPEVLRAQRQAFPILVVRGGFVFGNESLRKAPRELPPDSDGQLDRETRERIRKLYHGWLTLRGAPDMDPQESEELYGRIREYAFEHLDQAAPAWIRESLLAPRPDPSYGTENRLGILLLAGALIEARSRAGGGAGGGRPILIVEDPESHLHPSLLASVWQLLDLMEAQKVVTTNSEAFLAEVPLEVVCRLEREPGRVRARSLRRNTLRPEELRKVSYHVRLRRGEALFARSWLLVEGETEFWLLPGLARQCGFELAVEGVSCVEFAQCGVIALTRLANDLGIEWHLLTDGDAAGESYLAQARSQLQHADEEDRITVLPAVDIEHYLWDEGFAMSFRHAAWGKSKTPKNLRRTRADPTIQRAIQKTSKPHMALEILRVLKEEDAEPPRYLRRAIEASVRLARREARQS